MYYILSILTAPGVITHELAHALFCVLSGVKIHRVSLFRFGRTAGYVVHEEPDKFYRGFLISFGPLLINSFLALLCFAQFSAPFERWPPWLFLYLGLVLGIHAIPSTGDAHSLFQLANRRVRRNPLVLLAYPLVLVLYVLNFLKRLHVDILYVGLLFYLGKFYL